MVRESNIIYKTFVDCINRIPVKRTRKELREMLLNYSIYGTLSNLNENGKEWSESAISYFIIMKPQIDANNRRFAGATKGGKAKNTKQEIEAEFLEDYDEKYEVTENLDFLQEKSAYGTQDCAKKIVPMALLNENENENDNFKENKERKKEKPRKTPFNPLKKEKQRNKEKENKEILEKNILKKENFENFEKNFFDAQNEKNNLKTENFDFQEKEKNCAQKEKEISADLSNENFQNDKLHYSDDNLPTAATKTAKNNENTEDKPKRKNFKRPTLVEVSEYCIERNNNVSPVAFVDFYESKGWMIGKNPMKDWKAAVRTWEQNNYNYNNSQNNTKTNDVTDWRNLGKNFTTAFPDTL